MHANLTRNKHYIDFKPFWCWGQNTLGNLVSNMSGDAMGPCMDPYIDRSSTAMILTKYDMYAFNIHMEGFQLYVPSIKKW